MKQASRQQFAKLTTELHHQGFTQSGNDYSLFIRRLPSGITIAAVYVDDMLLTGTNPLSIQSLKSHLNKVFGIKDLGKLHYFLGFEVGYSDASITLTQHKFAKDLLKEAALPKSKTVVGPLPLHLKLSANEGELYPDVERYRCLVGKLNFLINIRSDLSYLVQTLSQFLQSPRQPHYHALDHVLHYVA